MSVNLTKKQQNRLMNGYNIRVRPVENGEHNLLLNQTEQTKLRRAMRQGKSITISKHHIEGLGFNSVMRKVARTVKKGANKAIEFGNSDFMKKEVVPYAKEVMKPVVEHAMKRGRPVLDKKLKSVRERSERQVEDILINALGKQNKALIQDLVTEGSASLSKKASKQLDKLEDKIHEAMTHPDIDMVRGVDYDVIPSTEAHELPVAVAQSYEDTGLKGSGVHHKIVYIKGGKSKVAKFFKKVGRALGSVVKSPVVKKALTELGKQGVSTLVTGMTGSPVAGEMASNLTGNLVESGVDKLTDVTGDAMQGNGILTKKATEVRMVSKSGGALYVPNGGALYAPTSRGRGRKSLGKGLSGPVAGGKYYI
jgi:hypothetical protein